MSGTIYDYDMLNPLDPFEEIQDLDQNLDAKIPL